MKRRHLILAPERFGEAKTAHGVIRYGQDQVVAVIDPQYAGRRVNDVMTDLRSDAPFVTDVAQGLSFSPTSLLIGTAPRGGALPAPWRRAVLDAIEARLEIVSGLHDFLGSDAEFARAAQRNGTTIWDVRSVPDVPLFDGRAYGVCAPIVLTVGNDCAVGKMSASLELVRAARDAGRNAVFVPTGQTGILIAGWGICIDRVIADFAPGAVETLVLQAQRQHPELIVVEGQGAINHPAYAPVTLALLYGSAPDALVLVCDPLRTAIEDYDTPTLPYRSLIALHESLLASVKPARVIGIALNTRGLCHADALSQIARAETETGLPADDVVRFSGRRLYAEIAPHIAKNRRAAVAS